MMPIADIIPHVQWPGFSSPSNRTAQVKTKWLFLSAWILSIMLRKWQEISLSLSNTTALAIPVCKLRMDFESLLPMYLY